MSCATTGQTSNTVSLLESREDAQANKRAGDEMIFPEYEQFDAIGLAELIRCGEVSCGEVIEAAIERIETRNPRLNAVVAAMFGDARQQVRSGISTGPLQGVPFMLKDLNTFCAGVPATNGSRAFREFVPARDSVLVSRYRASGLIILGKTNTPEFGLNVSTEPVLFGATRNPHDETLSAGGSSGGSACAVASGMLPAAHATDSGGSIRIPASNCGLYGLKPSRGRVPLGNDQGEGLAGFSAVNAVSHTVRDNALLLDIASGPVPGDPYAAPPTTGPYLQCAAEAPEVLRLALWTEGFANETIHADCAEAAQVTAAACEALGHRVEVARPDVDGEALRAAFDVLFAGNIRNVVSRFAATHPETDLHSMFEPVVIACSDKGALFGASDYAAAVQCTQGAARALGTFFERYQALITPTLANPPLPLGAIDMQSPDWDDFLHRLLDEIPFTPLFNATGAPAASLPMGKSAQGLPVGVQIGAALGREDTVLRLSAQLEAAHPWRHV